MGYKLLLADDSITIQKVVELVLAGEGFDIKATSNGEEALSVRPSCKPDVILADIAMPVMNGYQLCEKIKSNPETRNIPVILLAGAFEPIDEELARKVGADDYIVKPFESQELIGKVMAVLEGRMAAGEAAAVEVETEPVEALVSEDDLWTMEEVSSVELAEEMLGVEAIIEEGVGFEKAFLTAEGSGGPEEELEAMTLMEEEVIEEISPRAGTTPVAEPPRAPSVQPRVQPPIVQPQTFQPRIEVPSREEVAGMLRSSIDEKVASLLSVSDVKDFFRASIEKRVASLLASPAIGDSLLEGITASIRDSAERVVADIAPQVIERLLTEMLQGMAVSLSKEVERVVWETVPDLAETVITREIEKIKAEI